jgi:3-oxoacyl-[acyl-carrier-protein] synthase II
MGVVAPNALGVDAFADALLAGKSGITEISHFDATHLPTRIAGEVRVRLERPLPDSKVAFLLAASKMAWEHALAGASSPPLGGGGIVCGVGLELFRMEDLVAKDRPGFTMPRTRRERLSFMQTPSDVALHLVSRAFNLTRPPIAHVSACAAGTDAVGHAMRLVREGRWDFALAGGTDSMVNPMGVAGFCALSATTTRNEAPQRASRPFDRTRDGFVMGEGAGVLVLEREDRARARGATLYGEIRGYGGSLDAHGISEPHPEGKGAAMAMSRALEDAGLSPEEIDAINAHGTSTPKNDPVETRAIKTVFGARAKDIPISATKSMIGHLISAAGAVEAIAALACANRGYVHPTINLTDADPACDLDYVPHVARRHAQRHVLSASYGFGGHNAAIVVASREALT